MKSALDMVDQPHDSKVLWLLLHITSARLAALTRVFSPNVYREVKGSNYLTSD